MTISTLPPFSVAAPTRADPTTFSARGDVMMTELVSLVPAMNTTIGEMNATAASMTALAVGTAIAIPMLFSTTTTDSDPGNGYIRLNNATQNLATTVRTDLIGSDLTTWTNVFDTFDDSSSAIKGVLAIKAASDPTKFLIFNVTALASPTGYKNITVNVVSSSEANPFTNGQSVLLEFIRNGDRGDTGLTGLAGAHAGPLYTYSTTTTAADPGAGFFRFNNATLASATALYISETDASSNSISALLGSWDDSNSAVKGQLRLQKVGDTSKFALYNLSGTLTDNGTWNTFTVSYVSGSTLANNDSISFVFNRTGDVAVGVLPMGSFVPLSRETTNPVVQADGSVFLRTGTLATEATYPNGPKAITSSQKPVVLTYTSFGNSIFVSVSSLDIWTSSDGLTWTYIGAVAPVTGLGFGAYGSSKWVFPSSAGAYSTTDFITWSFVKWPDTGTVANLEQNTVIFANGLGRFLVVSNAAYLYTSTDGVTWTKTTGVATPCAAVGHNGGSRVVAVSPGGDTYYSDNGTSFTTGGILPFPFSTRATVAFGASLFVVTGQTCEAIMSSPDGVTWTSRYSMTGSATDCRVVWTGSKFISNIFTSLGSYVHSTNGTSWTVVAAVNVPGLISATSYPVPRAANTSGIVVGIDAASSNGIVTNDSGAGWWRLNWYDVSGTNGIRNPTSGSSTKALVSAYSAGDRIQVIERTNANFRVKISVTGGGTMNYIAYNGTTWVAGSGSGTTVYSSTTGLTWTARTTVASFSSLAANSTRFLTANATTSGHTSTDGITWSTATYPAAFNAIYAVSGVFLATLASSPTYYTSTDGVSWTARTTPAAISLSVAPIGTPSNFNGGSDGTYFFTAPILDASGNCIYVSTDGVTWTRKGYPQLSHQTPTLHYSASNSASGGYIWIASGDASTNVLLASSDGGTTWYMANTGLSQTKANHVPILGAHYGNQNAVDASVKYVGHDIALHLSDGGQRAPYYIRVA